MYTKSKTKQGITVVSNALSFYQSVTLGIWIKTGSRFEQPHQRGMAHFIEHMLFKGTQKREGPHIALALEQYGANLNAFTSREETCFYIQTPHSALEPSLEVLADMLTASRFAAQDIQSEREVILEEIAAVEDTPDEYVVDLFQEHLFPDQSLGHPILGSRESVSAHTAEGLMDFWRQHYTADNMVVAAAGRVDHRRLHDSVENYFEGLKAHGAAAAPGEATMARGGCFEHNSGFSQAHICCGTAVCSATDEQRFALQALHVYLGAGMSSRLFQLMREENAMVYSVYSFPEFLSDTGLFSIYLGTDGGKSGKALDLLKSELECLVRRGIDRDTLERVKRQMRGRLMLSLESTYNRMVRLAKHQIFFDKPYEPEEIYRRIGEIALPEIEEAARAYFNFEEWIVTKLQ